MNDLRWTNCDSCQFPTECRRKNLPERGCLRARTVWLCPVCAHGSLGELLRDPWGKQAEETQRQRYEGLKARQDLAWGLNFLLAQCAQGATPWEFLAARERTVAETAEREAIAREEARSEIE